MQIAAQHASLERIRSLIDRFAEIDGRQYHPSARTVRWRIDLDTGIGALVDLETAMPIRNPCQGDCEMETQEVSPDGKWQAVFANGAREDTGIWLVSARHARRPAEHVPLNARWF